MVRIVLAAGLVAVVAVVLGVRASRQHDCATASRLDSDSTAVIVCQREYDRTKLPLTGVYLADAYRRADNLEAASALANELLATTARADALQTLAKIALRQDRTDDAVQQLQEARRLHRAQGNHVELARDDQALARIQDRLSQYAEALQTLDEAIAEATVAGDPTLEAFCRLTAAKVLTSVGYFEAAYQESDRAAQHLTIDRDLAQLWYARGNLEQEVERSPLRHAHHEQAIAAFERSLELAQRSGLTTLIVNIHMNLAYSLAEVGRTEEADRHLAEATSLDSNGRYKSQRAQLAARIAYRRGNLSLAYTANDRLYGTVANNDERIEICVMQARIARAMNDPAAALVWAQRGVEVAEKIRAAQTLSELRPWVLASRREPLEVLFTELARAGRAEESAVTFDQWQGRTMLDEMARPSPEPSAGLSSTASRVQSLGRWLPVVSQAPLMTSDPQAVTKTLTEIDLVALAVAEGDVWRLAVNHGRFQLDNLGSFKALRERLDRFIAAPTDPALGDELGALVLTRDLMVQTDDPLYVVLDAPLAALPFVALRWNGQPLIAARPVLRAPRIPTLAACEPRADIGNALVIADAAGDLPGARRESSRVASLFGTTPLLGAAATSTALFAAKSDALLHLAVHAEVDAGGGVLKLHDRAVSAAEISANKLAPSLVVLSACSTARSWDPELAGSLSTAFLVGGSRQVIATLRPVSDAGALELTSRFYDAEGVRDPVRTLARIQAKLAGTDNKEWPNFAVFGNGRWCRTGP